MSTVSERSTADQRAERDEELLSLLSAVVLGATGHSASRIVTVALDGETFGEIQRRTDAWNEECIDQQEREADHG